MTVPPCSFGCGMQARRCTLQFFSSKALADEIERILLQRNHPDTGSKQSEGDAEQKKRAAGAPGSLKT